MVRIAELKKAPISSGLRHLLEKVESFDRLLRRQCHIEPLPVEDVAREVTAPPIDVTVPKLEPESLDSYLQPTRLLEIDIRMEPAARDVLRFRSLAFSDFSNLILPGGKSTKFVMKERPIRTPSFVLVMDYDWCGHPAQLGKSFPLTRSA